MTQFKTQLTLAEFLALPEGDITYELINGEAVPKMSPKRFHSRVTGVIYTLLSLWTQNRGEVGIEWAVKLKRNGKDWIPVPDLLYISYSRLPQDNILDEACPIPPDLAIEIINHPFALQYYRQPFECEVIEFASLEPGRSHR